MSDELLSLNHIEIDEYLLACARIRNVAPATLVRRLLHIIRTDMLVGAILDDADSMQKRSKSEHRFKGRPLGRDI